MLRARTFRPLWEGRPWSLLAVISIFVNVGADIPLDANAAGRYLLNAADFPESRNVRNSGRRTDCCAKRVASGEGTVRGDALFLMDVTSETTMRPVGRCGPSPTFSCLEAKQLELGGLHPG